jgi:hypothetical protein
MLISDRQRASFETRSSSAPQDEVDLFAPSKITLILRRPQSGRLEGRTLVMQGVAAP